MNTIISIPLKEYKVLRTGRLSQVCPGVLQYVNSDNNTVTFTIKLDELDNFETMWANLIANIKFNTNNGEHLNNVKRLLVIGKDPRVEKYFTLIHEVGVK